MKRVALFVMICMFAITVPVEAGCGGYGLNRFAITAPIPVPAFGVPAYGSLGQSQFLNADGSVTVVDNATGTSFRTFPAFTVPAPVPVLSPSVTAFGSFGRVSAFATFPTRSGTIIIGGRRVGVRNGSLIVLP